MNELRRKRSTSKDAADEVHRPAKARDTRTSILKAAEELFANEGLHGTSIRDVANAADVPPALVLYYFATKDELYQEIFRYRSTDLGEVRERRLSALQRDGKKPELREVLDAMVRPLIELKNDPGGVAYARLIAREVSDPSEASRGIISKTLDPIARRFVRVLVEAVPDLPEYKVHWAYHFLIASLIWVMANTGRIERLSEGRCDVEDPDATIREIVDFFASGIEGLRSAKRKSRKSRAARGKRVIRSRHTGVRNEQTAD